MLMNTQVHLNPTKLAVLLVPRNKLWIFTGPLLLLLHAEARKTGQSDDESESASEDDESDYDSYFSSVAPEDPCKQKRGSSPYLAGHNSEKSWSSGSSGPRQKFTDSVQIDNSSKDLPLNTKEDHLESDTSSGMSEVSSDTTNYFFHVAFSPNECTIMCSQSAATEFFTEPLKVCKNLGYNNVQLLERQFLSLQVDTDGVFNNSSRILELTRPFSENNISLYFLSSHFSDIVLIPFEFKDKVTQILAQQNFEFSHLSNSYIGTSGKQLTAENFLGPKLHPNFETYNSQITPEINYNLKLLLTGSRPGEENNTILKTAKLISSNRVPSYFSITRTSSSEVSLILPKSSKARAVMGFGSKFIIGSTDDFLLPITVDLTTLPLDSAGIVSGLASKIIAGIKQAPDSADNSYEMCYLSMAKSGIIMIPQENMALVARVLGVGKTAFHEQKLAEEVNSQGGRIVTPPKCT